MMALVDEAVRQSAARFPPPGSPAHSAGCFTTLSSAASLGGSGTCVILLNLFMRIAQRFAIGLRFHVILRVHSSPQKPRRISRDPAALSATSKFLGCVRRSPTLDKDCLDGIGDQRALKNPASRVRPGQGDTEGRSDWSLSADSSVADSFSLKKRRPKLQTKIGVRLIAGHFCKLLVPAN